jgi:hypothetical protein
MNSHYFRCSRASARGFVKLFLSINQTPYFFHQTLTFKGEMLNEAVARKYLKVLLDALEKAYPEMACFWVIEYREKEGGIHFHIIFLFFGQQSASPERMRETFGADVFERWNGLHGNTLFRRANLMTLQRKDFRCIEYLTKYVALSAGTDRGLHWYGIRNNDLIRANSTPPQKAQVTEYLCRLFDEQGKGREFKPIKRAFRKENGRIKGVIDYGRSRYLAFDYDPKNRDETL